MPEVAENLTSGPRTPMCDPEAHCMSDWRGCRSCRDSTGSPGSSPCDRLRCWSGPTHPATTGSPGAVGLRERSPKSFVCVSVIIPP